VSQSQQELRSLVEQLEALKSYIGELQARLQVVLNELEEVRLSRNTLTQLRDARDGSILVALDRRGHALVYAQIVDKEHVVIALGGDLYAKVPIERAIQVLTEREREIARIAGDIESEIKKVTNLYNEISKKLQQALTQKGNQRQSQQ